MEKIDAYEAFLYATKHMVRGSEFFLHPMDLLDLQKLTPEDLENQKGYDKATAEQVTAELMQGNLAEFSRAEGLQVTEDPNAPRLVSYRR
jgi:hypothetical protein